VIARNNFCYNAATAIDQGGLWATKLLFSGVRDANRALISNSSMRIAMIALR